MTYERLNFKNRSVERPRTYSVTENGDGTITLRDAFGQIYVEGTPLDAANMNYLEDGIASSGLTKYEATTTYAKNELVLDMVTGNIYSSKVDNNKGTTLTNTSYWKLLVIGRLETARKINGTNFDGTADITTTNWGTARNFSIANSDGTGAGTTVSVNGAAAVTLRLPKNIKADIEGKATQDGNGNNIADTYQPKSTAVTHSASTAVGSATKPVYVAANGAVSAITSYEGNAATATKATQDSAGNVINATYQRQFFSRYQITDYSASNTFIKLATFTITNTQNYDLSCLFWVEAHSAGISKNYALVRLSARWGTTAYSGTKLEILEKYGDNPSCFDSLTWAYNYSSANSKGNLTGELWLQITGNSWWTYYFRPTECNEYGDYSSTPVRANTDVWTYYDKSGASASIASAGITSGYTQVRTTALNPTATILSAAYPVGSIYLSVGNCPLAALIPGSQWVQVAQDRVLQGSGSLWGAGANPTQGLPDMGGAFANVSSGVAAGATRYSGVFATSNYVGYNANFLVPAGSVGVYNIGFSASSGNSTYSQPNGRVQPYAYVVNVWQRTA